MTRCGSRNLFSIAVEALTKKSSVVIPPAKSTPESSRFCSDGLAIGRTAITQTDETIEASQVQEQFHTYLMQLKFLFVGVQSAGGSGELLAQGPWLWPVLAVRQEDGVADNPGFQGLCF